MNRYNKITILVFVFLTALNIAACGQVKEDEIVNIENLAVNQQESDIQTSESTDTEINEEENVKEAFTDQQENSTQAVENADSERTAEELLDLFINGSISAVDPTDLTSAFYITDLNMDSGEWDSFSIGEKVDLDNDGENELIINGPYGGIYLDARDNRVYKFAAGEGNACTLSYTYFNGNDRNIWIMYSNRMNAGYEAYHMEKFEGADNLVAEINFGEELVDSDNAESETKYTWNGEAISYDEYTALCSKIFAAEVSTNHTDLPEEGNVSQTGVSFAAYREVVEQNNTGMFFSLINLNGDEIPELVMGDRGNDRYSIYTIKDGVAICLVDSMTTVELTYFEGSGIIAAFARWNGGGDEGGYGRQYYQTSVDRTLTDEDIPILSYSYNAIYDQEGVYTGKGDTDYFYMGQETDEASYNEILETLRITENGGRPCMENAVSEEEMLDTLRGEINSDG